MSILQTLGLTKDAIARLLGVTQAPVQQPKPITAPKSRKTYKGRKQWTISKRVVDAVRNEPSNKTLVELSHKYNVSVYWVWSVRKNKIRVNWSKFSECVLIDASSYAYYQLWTSHNTADVFWRLVAAMGTEPIKMHSLLCCYSARDSNRTKWSISGTPTILPHCEPDHSETLKTRTKQMTISTTSNKEPNF